MLIFKASSGAVDCLRFTSDGRGLVTGAGGGAAVWDVTGTPALVYAADPGGALHTHAVAASPCGRFVAFGGAAVWAVELANPGRQIRLPEAVSTSSLAFAPDGSEFATAAYYPRQWAVPSWQLIRAEPPPLQPDIQEFCTGRLAYTPDGKTLGVAFARLSDDESRYDSCAVLFDRTTGRRTGRLMMPFGHAHPTRIAFSPDGAVIAGNFGPVLGVVSTADGAIVARIKPGARHITDLAFTPDGSQLATVSNDARVRVYDARAWTEAESYAWKAGKLRSVAVAPDGLRMAAGSGTGKVVIWDADV